MIRTRVNVKSPDKIHRMTVPEAMELSKLAVSVDV